MALVGKLGNSLAEYVARASQGFYRPYTDKVGAQLLSGEADLGWRPRTQVERYCSINLQANTMWTDTIGLAQDAQAGSNAAVEASLSAPQHRTGRAARRQVATEAAGSSHTAGSYSQQASHKAELHLWLAEGLLATWHALGGFSARYSAAPFAATFDLGYL